MDQRIARALRVLEARMDQPPAVRSLARALDLSHHHFHRLFLAETGETPAAYLRRIRLDAAAIQLRWGAQPVGVIALTLGYESQSAFTRAFSARFKAPPGRFRTASGRAAPALDQAVLRRIAVRTLDPIRVVARRYVGDPWAVRGFWRDFAGRLPDGIANGPTTRYLGLVHDDPRVTPPEHCRYDCCATLGPVRDPALDLAGCGLHVIATRGGSYARFDHRGPRETVISSYDTLFDHWVALRGQRLADDPAIELHLERRDLQPPGDLRFAILAPLE